MPVALSSFFVGLAMGGKGRGAVDLLRGDVKRTYFKYLGAAFGSAMLAAVYSLVDMAMVGQYQGPDGAAALAVVAPVWNILYSLGMLTGMGGSVLYSAYRGQGRVREANRVFTVALGTTVVIACLVWAGLVVWEVPLIRFFGGEGELIPLAQAYLYPVKFCVPLFLLNQMLAAFLRNDGRPALATGAVVAGGVFNIFGDYYLVFVADLGILGAGIATCLGAGIAVLLMATHFLSRRNTLRLVRGGRTLPTVGKIGVTGFSAFFVDIAMGILTILFNRQIMAWLGTDALAVYGVLVNVSTLVQCCGYSVGQAAQPILSQNHGARQGGADPGGAAVRPVHGGGLRGGVDGGPPPLPPAPHRPVHGPHGPGVGHRPGDLADLWPVLPAAALQRLFHLLPPGSAPAGERLRGVGGPGAGGQRRAHPGPAHPLRRAGPVVGHAHHRGGGGPGGGRPHGPLRPGPAGREIMKNRPGGRGLQGGFRFFWGWSS